MTAAVVVLLVSLAGAAVTALDPTLEMWSPLLVSVGPLLAYMLWPRRDEESVPRHHASDKAA